MPQLFAAFANKQPEQEQRGSFERKGIADRIVESTTAKMTPVFTEPEHKIDNIHIENGVYRIHEEKDAASNVKINYDFKRLVDSVLNGWFGLAALNLQNYFVTIFAKCVILSLKLS